MSIGIDFDPTLFVVQEYILSLQRERLAAQARERRDRDQVTYRVEEKKKEKSIFPSLKLHLPI